MIVSQDKQGQRVCVPGTKVRELLSEVTSLIAAARDKDVPPQLNQRGLRLEKGADGEFQFDCISSHYHGFSQCGFVPRRGRATEPHSGQCGCWKRVLNKYCSGTVGDTGGQPVGAAFEVRGDVSQYVESFGDPEKSALEWLRN